MVGLDPTISGSGGVNAFSGRSLPSRSQVLVENVEQMKRGAEVPLF
jgi:hypothetical protein